MLVIESINDTPLDIQPLNDGYNIEKSDLLSGSSGRSAETGKAIRYLVRDNVYKLSLKFKGNAENIAQVDSLVSAFEQKVVFYENGIFITKNMYPGNRKTSTNGYISELSVDLIEI